MPWAEREEEHKVDLDEMKASALAYCDKRLAEEYNGLIKRKADLKKNNLSNLAIQYLYMGSFFPRRRPFKGSETAISYYQKQAGQFWLQQNPYMQGMIAMALHRIGDTRTPQAILASLKENSISNDELGRYWKENQRGYYWQESPIETQALLIEAFSEISKDEKAVNELKTWMLRQKQTNHWSSTRSTADACYALLLKGTQWINIEPVAVIKLGDQLVFDQTSSAAEGLGYRKRTYEGKDIKPEMGNISVTVSSPGAGESPGPSWGAVYWQYFEDLDKISAAASPLSLVRKLFIEKNTDKGPVLKPVSEEEVMKVGDKIKVRMELRVDRDLEYVHLKDQRAASMEPVNVVSGYKWQGGLGYYESTQDATTNFFFDFLPKGTYVFEYPLFITHIGRFSAGISTIQCMYAPEFTSHSEGIRIKVK